MSTVTITRGFNGEVATRPFPKTGVDVKTTSAFATIQNRSTLTQLEVVFGDGIGISPGDTVWVRADGAMSWGKTQTVGDQDLAIVPPEYIMLVTRTSQVVEVPPRPAPTRIPGPGIAG